MNQKKNLAFELLTFSFPLILSGILQQLYSWADAFIVGHAEGQLQLASIGATSSISGLLLYTIIGLTVGISIMAAQEFGRGNEEKIPKIASSFLPAMLAFYIPLAILGIVFAESALNFVNTPAEIYGYSMKYLQIILLGIPFMVVYNLYAAIFRAVGNTKVAFFAILISSAVNVLLDILFVVVLPWGVGGAAFATVISQAAMSIFVFIYGKLKYPRLMPSKGRFAFDKAIFREGLGFCLPPALQHSIASLGSVALQNFMNSFGSATILAISTAYRVDSIMLLPIINLGAAVSSISARAEGARDDERIRMCLKTGCAMMLIVALLLSLAMYLWGSYFVALFGVCGEALSQGQQFFRDISIFYTLFGIATVIRSVLEGIGDIRFCSVLGICTLFVRIAMSYILRPLVGARAIAFAEGISWVFLLSIVFIRLVLKHRKLIKKQKSVC